MAHDEDDFIFQLVVVVAGRGHRVEPDDADDNLHEGVEENQQELEVKSPSLSVEAGGYFGFKYQEDMMGLHQETQDTEHEADAEGRLSKACPILGLSNEEQEAGEAAE